MKFSGGRAYVGTIVRYLLATILLVFSGLFVATAYADDGQAAKNQAQVMQSFERQTQEAEQAKSLSDKQKHRIMFFLGVPLLVFILIAVGFGIAMGVYGKQVFVWHMLFAGLSATLAIVHAIVGLVWFYPFR